MASICGLGQVVHVPIASVMKHFPEEVEAHARGICAAGVCFRDWSDRVSDQITLSIDGRDVSVPKGTTIFDAARLNGIPIPTLCHQQNQTPVGVCRVCVVDVGARVYPASCIRECEPNMKVSTDRARRRQGADDAGRDADGRPSVPLRPPAAHRRLRARDHGARRPAWPSRASPRRLSPRGRDDSSLSIAVDHEACILCDRCMRGCDDIKKNMVIGRSGSGYTAHIAFDLDNPMGSSTCVSCGECMVSCPTGALTNKRVDRARSSAAATRLDAEWILQLPVFKGVSGTFLELNQGAVVKRHDRGRRDHLPRRGVRFDGVLHPRGDGRGLHRHADQARPAGRRARAAGSARIRSKLSSRDEHTRAEESARRFIPDRRAGRSALRQADRRARRRRSVRRDDLHELPSALGDRPRETEVRVLEMLRNVLDILQKNKTFRAELERKYRARALETHLSSVPVFASMPQDFIDLPARPGRADPAFAGRSDRPAGRPGRRLLPGPHRVREGHREASRRRASCSTTSGADGTSARWACSAAASAPRPAPRSTTSTSSRSPATTST